MGASNIFDFNSIAKIDADIETLDAVTLAYKSNKPWFVNVNANTADFKGSSPTLITSSVIQFRLNGNASYSTLSTQAELLQLKMQEVQLQLELIK